MTGTNFARGWGTRMGPVGRGLYSAEVEGTCVEGTCVMETAAYKFSKKKHKNNKTTKIENMMTNSG